MYNSLPCTLLSTCHDIKWPQDQKSESCGIRFHASNVDELHAEDPRMETASVQKWCYQFDTYHSWTAGL